MRTCFVATVLICVSCITTNAVRLDESIALAPICPAGVRVFTDSSKVGQPYQEIALIDSKGDDEMTGESGMLQSEKRKAADLGANGLILGVMQGASTGAKVWHALLWTKADRKAKATAIYIAADSLRVRTACREEIQ